jgi:CheY-like chemotaxis protein
VRRRCSIEPVTEGSSRTVLLVEDDPDHAELVSRALSADGIRLVHVSDGESALAYLGRAGMWTDVATSPRPDLVLLDLRLPGVDGGEVLRQIKAAPALREIAVAILSTSEAWGDLGTAGEQADACAVKPIDGEAFREQVRELVSSWTARRPRGGAA